MSGSSIINKLIDDHGMNKGQIARLIGCYYSTIFLWSKNAYNPGPTYQAKLEALLAKKEAEKQANNIK